MIPQVSYYTEKQFRHLFEPLSTVILEHDKREPISAITVAVLLGLGIARTNTGISSLILQHQKFNSLQEAMDSDIDN